MLGVGYEHLQTYQQLETQFYYAHLLIPKQPQYVPEPLIFFSLEI